MAVSLRLGDLELLSKLINSTPMDLTKLFKARKRDNTYIIPLLREPWVLSIDLNDQYSLESGNGRLSVEGVDIKVNNRQARVVAGFLASNGYIYGSYIGGGGAFKCMRININTPTGLAVPLNNIIFESTQAYVSRYEGRIIVPRCTLSSSAGLTTSKLIFAALNAQAIGNVTVEISTLKVLYL
ncbi:MAG: hypothetical protein RXN84_01870 [Caldivirga sp.]|uniref:hypothetical protein n=1 Tax=Caldivirga sp. MU80 TaxID=1650354 RepID=UPI00082D4F07|nr:hypothetical protein [Caldivirga sp. MU80]